MTNSRQVQRAIDRRAKAGKREPDRSRYAPPKPLPLEDRVRAQKALALALALSANVR